MVAQLLADARRIDDQMLVIVGLRHVERRRQRVVGRHDNAASPTGRAAYEAQPCRVAERFRLTYVVGPVRRALIARSQRDGRRDVLDVAARPSPTRDTLLQEDRGALVVHALQLHHQTVLIVAFAVDHRKPQHRSREQGAAHRCPFDEDLLVAIEPAARPTIWVQLFPERRVFSQRHLL